MTYALLNDQFTLSIWSAASAIPTICGSVGAPPACAFALAGCNPTTNMIAADQADSQ